MHQCFPSCTCHSHQKASQKNTLSWTIFFFHASHQLHTQRKITHLYKSPATHSPLDQGLGNPASSIGCTSVNLRWVLPRQGSTTMGSPPSVSVHNDLSSCQTSIPLQNVLKAIILPKPQIAVVEKSHTYSCCLRVSALNLLCVLLGFYSSYGRQNLANAGLYAWIHCAGLAHI